jgi:Cu(I)/Ag(I) efflux system membrane fusion protein
MAAVLTAGVLIGGMAIQRSRSAWPFQAAPQHDMAAMDDASSASVRSTVERSPVDTASARTLELRVEPVTRASLTQTIRAVATIAPDESRISHAHTRVSGWVEQLFVNTTGELVQAGQPL